MQWLVLIPLINVGIWVIVVIVSSFVHEDKNTYKGPPLNIDTYMPDGEKYKDVKVEHEPNPTIAEQFDGRLTNVFKNPLEGIL